MEISPETLPKKKRHTARWIVGWLIAIFALLFAITFAMNIGRENTKYGSFTPIIQGDFLSVKKEGTTNILIAWIGGRGHEWSDLTDSIMLASLNVDEKRINLLSIPRDLYVSYPEGKGAGRINSLYELGKGDKVGIKYLADKVSEITGQPIDHYIVIDFSGFKKIVDTLGGVEIDVPEELIDPEYPDENYGYEVLHIKKWLQVMDGETALKYARSRHSTSDFDRSIRQQLLIKALKEKILSTNTLTSPTAISDIFSAIMDHLDSDLSLANMAEMTYGYRSIKTESIKVFSLNNECGSIRQCRSGSYLYNPSRDLFGGASVLIPENARVNKLSYYDDIRRFVDLSFRYPDLENAEKNIVIVSTRNDMKKAQAIWIGLAKLGININPKYANIIATGTITQSHINIYWHPDLNIGINPASPVVESLKHLEESIPYIIVPHNEYVTDDGPKIEIVLWDDIATYFPFVTPLYYIPTPPPTNSGWATSWEAKVLSSEIHTGSAKPKVPQSTTRKQTTSSWGIRRSTVTALVPSTIIQPWEWEDFGN